MMHVLYPDSTELAVLSDALVTWDDVTTWVAFSVLLEVACTEEDCNVVVVAIFSLIVLELTLSSIHSISVVRKIGNT